MRFFPHSWGMQQPEQEVWQHQPSPSEGKQLKNHKLHSSAVLQGLKLFECWVLPHS